MFKNFYVNGKLKGLGATFEKIPGKQAQIPCKGNMASGEYNFYANDEFKVSTPHWRTTIGYKKTNCDPNCFVSSFDGYDGHNIRCIKDGRYKLTVDDSYTITIEYIGEPKENELSAWEVAGDMANYPDNWGIGPNKIYLKNIEKEKLPLKCSYYDFNCYSTTEPLNLEYGDQLKLAILNDTEWIKVAGKSLLKAHGENSQFGDDSFIVDGDESYGPNIRIAHPGKYVFYLCISKSDPENFEILWQCL